MFFLLPLALSLVFLFFLPSHRPFHKYNVAHNPSYWLSHLAVQNIIYRYVYLASKDLSCEVSFLFFSAFSFLLFLLIL